MKTVKSCIWMAAATMLVATLGACSNDDITAIQTPVQKGNVVTLTATLSPKGGDGVTRALTDNGTTIGSAWAVNEEISVEYTNADDDFVDAKGIITAVDGDGKATVSVNLVNPKDGNTDIYFHYPYSIAKGIKDLTADQIGTLDDIAANFDDFDGDGILSVSAGVATLPSDVTMTRNVSIWKLAFKVGDSDITNTITALNINISDGAREYDVTPSALDAIYVALGAVSSTNVTITAATPSGIYSSTKDEVTLDPGYFYRSTVTLTAAAACGTYRVYSDRITFDNEAIPGGATIVGNSATAVTWTAGTYVVNNDVTIDGGVTLAGNVNLILCDGAELTITNGHIECPKDEGNTWEYLYSMNIYGQTLGTGKLTVIDSDINIQAHNLGIHGGIITVVDGGVVQGIETDGTLNIYHGTINASCGANGIISMGTANIYGGIITANSTGIYGAAILAASGDLTISGGNIVAINTGSCAGIEASGNLTITGGSIMALGGNNSEGILSYGNITISGGDITARAGENGIGLEGNTTISGGIVTAIGGDAAASSDGDGRAGYDGALTMNGGKLISTGGAKDGTGNDGLGISDNSTIALTGVTMYEGDAANPATPAASQAACTKRYIIIQ